MRVIRVSNAMGGYYKSTALQAWVRQRHLWSLGHEISHATLNGWYNTALLRYSLNTLGQRRCLKVGETADDVVSNVVLRLLRLNKPCHVNVDGQRRTVFLGGYGQAHFNIETYEHILQSLHAFLKLTLFVAAFRAVVEALSYVIIVPIRGVIGLEDLIKALNLPKNLFPQSLRPIKAAAL